MLNSGGIKLSTCQSLTSKLRGCVDAGPRGIPDVARFVQQRIEHQRDRQKNRTQSWNGEEISALSSSACTPRKVKEARQTGRLSRIHSQFGFWNIPSLPNAFNKRFQALPLDGMWTASSTLSQKKYMRMLLLMVSSSRR